MNKQEKITQYCLLFEMALFKLSSKISKCFGEKFIVIAIKEDSEEYRKMKKYDIIKFSKIKSKIMKTSKFEKADKKADKKQGVKEGSKKDIKMDKLPDRMHSSKLQKLAKVYSKK